MGLILVNFTKSRKIKYLRKILKSRNHKIKYPQNFLQDENSHFFFFLAVFHRFVTLFVKNHGIKYRQNEKFFES